MQPEEDPDAAWVAELAGASDSRALGAIGDASNERRLFRHLERMHRLGARPSYIEIDAPLELYALVRLLRPAHVVEVGVSSGVSSAYLLQAMERVGRGTLHSVDLPKMESRSPSRGKPRTASWSIPPGRSSGWAVPFPLRRRWDLRLGDKKEVLPLLGAELPSVGLFVYDVPHAEEQAALDFAAVDPRLRLGAVAIADHGPGGGLCAPLARWARSRSARPLRRAGLGLHGFRCGPRGRR
jgi:methyltransferase family protein